MASKSNCKRRSPAETVAGNEDLLNEILLRVPAKPLLKFKSVSKSWLSLISSPRFIRLHTLHNSNSVVSGLFLRRNPTQFQFLSLNTNQVSSVPLNFTRDRTGIKILQSCNGLLLCSSFRKYNNTGYYYYVYNPTTNSFFTLPPLTVDEKKAAVFGVNLAFEPSQSLFYKVVCVRSTENSLYFYQIEIYESEFGAWRRLSGSPFVAPYGMDFYNGVFWNGSIHWISPRGKSLCFDLKNECLKKMPNLPFLGSWGESRFRYLGESTGHLHLIEIYGPHSTQFKVFEMERDYSNWFVKYKICLDVILTAYPGMVRSYLDVNDSNHYAFVPLFVVREQSGVDASLLLHVPGKILSYNMRDKTFKQLFDFDAAAKKASSSSLQFGWLDTYPYFQSLVPV